MGGNLLRRKILRKKKIQALFLAAVVCFAHAGTLSADEKGEGAPEAAPGGAYEKNPPGEALFSRPMRSRPVPRADYPLAGGVPSFQRAGETRYPAPGAASGTGAAGTANAAEAGSISALGAGTGAAVGIGNAASTAGAANAAGIEAGIGNANAASTAGIAGTANAAGIEAGSPAAPTQSPPGKSFLLTQEALENPLTRQYIRQYSSPGGLSWLSAVMERGTPYIAFIRKEIAERGLPEELIYLPVIESGYLSTAVSRSGAAGLWQFMKNSIAPFDMTVNEWIDERRDFWKSTQGALQKLEENYNFFGNWPLALAAYNAGLGAVNRVARQNNSRDYWVLSQKKLLKTETIHYVPKLLAAAYILSNPRRFGMEPRWPEDPLWKQVAVDRPVDLRILAREAEINPEELIRANRELLYNVTPPGQGYFLKIPGKDAEKIAAVLARKDIPLIRYYFHTISSGDTLLALARHYGITVQQITASNPGIRERYLRIGNRLIIPALKETGPYVRPAVSRENLVFSGTHLVKRGETLWSIALAYEVAPEVLAEINGLELTGILREGRTLKTPIK